MNSTKMCLFMESRDRKRALHKQVRNQPRIYWGLKEKQKDKTKESLTKQYCYAREP